MRLAAGIVRLEIETMTVLQKPAGRLKLTASSTTNWREWWREESVRVGSDWQSIIALHLQICARLRAASSSWSSSP
jgi:hypothetical protein